MFASAFQPTGLLSLDPFVIQLFIYPTCMMYLLLSLPIIGIDAVGQTIHAMLWMLEVVFQPSVAVRSAPSTSANIISARRFGEVHMGGQHLWEIVIPISRSVRDSFLLLLNSKAE